jgi:hypothetical protein
MRLRFLAALSAALLATALAPAAAFAAPDHSVPLKGTMWTTMAPGDPGSCTIVGKGTGFLVTIVENGQVNSTLTHLGKVTLVQHECVVPTAFQFPGGPPASGWVQVQDGTITAANGDTVTFTTPPEPFQTFEPPGIGPGPLPIAFSGTLTITGGTGRFASADGSAHFDGMYCFRVNGGTYTLAGRLTR